MNQIEPNRGKKPKGAAANMLALPEQHQLYEYQIQRMLGGGAFGITYLARDTNLDLTVAIKEYMPMDLSVRDGSQHVAPNSDASAELFQWGLERFIDEARVLANFRHPNIVRVLRYFKANGTAYIVMEYESGEPLKNWMSAHSPIDPEGLLAVINPLLDGLELMHKGDFLHRDIKPDNVYIRRDGTPVLLDFGAARRVTPERELTAIFSPGFAPFEQYHSHGNQGPWTDIYSLAAVMYWMIGGEKPTEAAARLKNHAMVPAVGIDRNNLFPVAFLETIDWALESEESRRPQTIPEFRTRLNQSLTGPRAVSRVSADANRLDFHIDSNTRFNANFQTEANGKRNFICTLMFLDIVAYSKCPVDEQFSLKSEFNQIISARLAHIPHDSRITLDTGDGAAICFMGDPEEVLHAAEEIQKMFLAQKRLQVRMGLHIGPIRILNDLNNRNNLIGDGINVAQRVMSFADNNQLLVSRAYYDVVSCLSDDAARRFRRLGEHRDKHDRPHELYAVISQVGEDDGSVRTQLAPQPAAETAKPIDAESVEILGAELCRLIGPLAPILVRKAVARARSVDDLREILSQSITDPVQKQSFLSSSGRQLDISAISGTTGGSQRTGSRSKIGGAGSAEPAGTNTLKSALTEEDVARLEKLFVQFIGPVGRILMKNELKKTADYRHLCQQLAQHIDNPEARATFIGKLSGPI
ncbi:serine/threonine-protein kinase PrkC [mine drainage metagenome]|uniref:Serine/threonine-protein kinase PrkC n=1 Tax=mine drainage metagenome TaxID=410659 RepID=A0A1J5TEU4_9ZZZZ